MPCRFFPQTKIWMWLLVEKANLRLQHASASISTTRTLQLKECKLSFGINFICNFVMQLHSLNELWYVSIPEQEELIFQVSRSIGDVYLKKAEFNREPLYAKFRLREPFQRPILSAEPSVSVHPLQPQDQFLIFASDGLWEHLSNQGAVDIVQNHPRSVSSQSQIGFFLDFPELDLNIRRCYMCWIGNHSCVCVCVELAWPLFLVSGKH